MKAFGAGLALIAAVFVLLPAGASARDLPKRSIAAARFGLVGSKVPRMGPALVRRGGYTALASMIRPRFYGGMTDIYPSANMGFRLSIGSRYFARPNFWSTAEQATRGILYDPRWRTSGGMQTGFRRKTYALTVGYDVQPVAGLVVGIEGGALNGRAISRGPRGPRLRSFRIEERSENRAQLNPIATLSIRYAF